MAQSQKSGASFFNNPLTRTKVRSANVKPVEALIGYLVGPFCGMLANCLFGTYLVEYFQKVLFADEIAAGNKGVETFLVLFPILSAILIVAGNLVAGQIIERTRTKAGKARPYILLSAVTIAVASVLMFIQPIDNAVFKMVWLAIAYNLFYAVAFPLYNTANSALVPVSTRNSKQRSVLASFVNMALLGGAGAGSIVMPMVILLFANAFPGPEGSNLPSSNGYLILFIIVGVVTFLGCIAQYYFTRERVTEETMASGEDKQEEKKTGPVYGKTGQGDLQRQILRRHHYFLSAVSACGRNQKRFHAVLYQQRRFRRSRPCFCHVHSRRHRRRPHGGGGPVRRTPLQ